MLLYSDSTGSIMLSSSVWYWGLVLVLGMASSGTTSDTVSELDFQIPLIPFMFGLIVFILCIVLLIVAILSRRDVIESNITKVLFIVFGVLILLLPWLEYGLEILDLTNYFAEAGITLQSLLEAGAILLPIPIAPILFLVAGILAIVGGSKL